MNATVKPSESDKFRSAYFNLETPIADLVHMVGIAHFLAFERLDGDYRKQSGDGEVIITMSPEEYTQLLFAISQASRMADDLGKLYNTKFDQAAGRAGA